MSEPIILNEAAELTPLKPTSETIPAGKQFLASPGVEVTLPNFIA
jgi:hypothetical protein